MDEMSEIESEVHLGAMWAEKWVRDLEEMWVQLKEDKSAAK